MSLQGRLNGRKITAGFDSPSSYTPTPAGNENPNKISAHLAGIDTALASAGGASFTIEVTQFQPDDTNPTTNVSVGSALKAIAFSASSDNIVWAQFTTDDNLDDTKDIKFEIMYSMSSAESSKKVSFNSDVWVYSDNEDPSKSADSSGLEDELSVPNDGKTDKVVLTTIKVGSSLLSGVGQVVALKLWRNTSDTNDTHSGDFQLISMRAYQD